LVFVGKEEMLSRKIIAGMTLFILLSALGYPLIKFQIAKVSAQTTPAMLVAPATVTVGRGQTFSVYVTFENMPVSTGGCVGCEFWLNWNASILECLSIIEVAFHTATPQAHWSNIVEYSLENASGYAHYAVSWLDIQTAVAAGYAPISGNGTWAAMTFHSLVRGQTALNLTSVVCGDVNTDTIPVTIFDGQVTVQAQSSTLVACSPTSAEVGSIVNCTAIVSGSSPTGTVTWTTNSNGTGYFNQSSSILSSGSCSTTYTDNDTGYFNIMASYGGDSNNDPSSGSATLTVFMNVTTGTNVTVTPTNNLELTFANVTAAGITVVNATPTVNAPPLSNTVGQYYNIKVTAGFSGNVTVGLAFDGSNLTQQQKSSLQMEQYTPIPGDIKGLGVVNILDAIALGGAFLSTPGRPNWNPNADLNGDGVVNILDAIILGNHFLQTANWVNITWYVDTTNNIVYGQTTHFSFITIH
jgi:hypothetical protein